MYSAHTMQSINQLRSGRRVTSVIHLLFAAVLLLSGCLPFARVDDSGLRGTVLVWHAWAEPSSTVLEGVLDSFIDLHPNVVIRSTYVPADRLQERFIIAAQSGLGPDLLLGPNRWIRPLADAGLIEPVNSDVPDNAWGRYLPVAVRSVQYDDSLYGIPQGLRTEALFYNTRLVRDPATTLDELLLQADAGQRVGISTDFLEAFWGVGAFGGRLFDDEQNIALNDGGFANWLSWLKTASETPNVVLGRDIDTLITLFEEEELAYLVGSTETLAALQAQTDAEGEAGTGEEQPNPLADVLEVASLPSGPIGAPSPLIETDTFLFSVASSARQRRLAVELALYVTNAEQSVLLMRRADRIPANARVRINPRVDSMAYSFVASARTAVAFDNNIDMEMLIEQGSLAYSQVLQGVAEPAAAAQSLTDQLSESMGLPISTPTQVACTIAGRVTLWHALGDAQAGALEQLLSDVDADCPALRIEAVSFSEQDLHTRLLDAERPDLLLLPPTLFGEQALAGTLRPLGTVASNEEQQALLQRFNAAAIDALRVDERVLGIPFALETTVLYVNRSLVDEPIRLLSEVDVPGVPGVFALDSAFLTAFWGVGAFGGTAVDVADRLTWRGGLTEWLNWLHAQPADRLFASDDASRLVERFLTGDVPYLAASSALLPQLSTPASGVVLDVAALPGGPGGEATPLLRATALALPTNKSDESAQRALAVAARLTVVEQQQKLFDSANVLPAHAAVTTDDPLLASVIEQLPSALPLPTDLLAPTVQERGTALYQSVLATEASPVEGAEDEAEQALIGRQVGEFLDELEE